MSSISTEQYDYLMSLGKVFKEEVTMDLSKQWTKDIISIDGRENFMLDYRKGKIEFNKISLNTRYRQNICLVRLCTMKAHTNPPPDNTRYPGAHLHIYDEVYGDAMAYPISVVGLSEPLTREEAFSKFSEFCKITIPRLQIVIGS